MPRTATLAEVVALLHGRADPASAEDWDRVGLVTGDPQHPVRRVLFAVDPLPPVVTEAVDSGCDLLVSHHPLLLRGVHSVAETTSRGRTVSALVRSRCALLTMHTNADQAAGGVSDALADAIGMMPDRRPLRPLPGAAMSRVVVYVPVEDADRLVAGLAAAGAGRLGDYDSCAFWVDGTGQFRPGPGAHPHVGAIGDIERVSERRVEMVFPRPATAAVVAALRAVHPYEEPAFSVVESVPQPSGAGLGRLGAVPPTTVADLAMVLARALPRHGSAVRVAGEPDRAVGIVAVCGGSGDSLLGDVAAAGADAYVTSDLRHHPVTDFRGEHDIALIDIPHAAAESLWLHTWSHQLQRDAADRDLSLTARVSAVNTDPWTFHLPARQE